MSHADHCPHCVGRVSAVTDSRCDVWYGTQPDQLQCVLPAGHAQHPTEDSHVGVAADGRVVPFGGVRAGSVRGPVMAARHGHCKDCGASFAAEWVGTTCAICDGLIIGAVTGAAE